MNETIKQFLVGLGFNVDQAGLKNFVSGITSASMRAATLGAAVTAAAGLIMKGIDSVAKDGEQLDLLAQRFNTTAAAMDDFGDKAEIMGIGSDRAFGSMKALNKVVGEAALGIGRGKIILEKLGISAKDSSGHVRSTADVMGDLQARLAKMDRGQAMTILEKMGIDPELVRMFNGELGNTAMIGKELSEIDASVGFDFDKTIAESKAYQQQSREMMVQVRLLQQWFSKLWAKLATDLMPMAREGLKKTSEAFEGFRKVLQENGKKIVAVLGPIISWIIKIGGAFVTLAGRALSVVLSVFGRVFDVIAKVNKATNGWAGYIAAVLVAWKLFNVGFLATPLGVILALAAGALLLYDDFMTWKEGGDSLIDWGSSFGAKIFWVSSAMAGLGVAIMTTKAIMSGYALAVNLVKIAMVGYQVVLKKLQIGMLLFNLTMAANPISLVVLAVMALIAAGALLIANWDTVKSWFSGFFDWFGQKWDALKNMIGGIADSISGSFGGVIAVFDGISVAIGGVADMIKALFNMDLGGFTDGFVNLGTGAVMALQSIGQSVINLISGITSLIGEVFRFFGFDVDGFANVFKSAFASIVDVINTVKGAIGSVIDTITSAGGIFGDIFGSGDKVVKASITVAHTMGATGSASAPSPTQQAAVSRSQNVAQTTNINVAGGSNPQATAQAVAGQQSGVNKNMARNMKGAVR